MSGLLAAAILAGGAAAEPGTEAQRLATASRALLDAGQTEKAIALAWLAVRGDPATGATNPAPAPAAAWRALFAALDAEDAGDRVGVAMPDRPALLHKFSKPSVDDDHEIVSAAFSPDGRRVLTGSDYDDSARLWDIATGRQIAVFMIAYHVAFASVAYGPHGKTMLSGNSDNLARLWDLAEARVLRTLTGHSGGVRSVAYSPDGRTALTGSGDATARLWDLTSGRELQRLVGHRGPLNAVAFSPDGRTGLTGSADGTARLWDLISGDEIVRFTGHAESVNAVAFSPDGRLAVSGSGRFAQRRDATDTLVRLWDTESGRERMRFDGHTAAVWSVAFSPDGRTVLSGSADRTARGWDVLTGGEVRRYGGHGAEVRTAAYSPDARTVLTGSEDDRLRIWRGLDYAVAFRQAGEIVAQARPLSAAECQRYRIANAVACRTP